MHISLGAVRKSVLALAIILTFVLMTGCGGNTGRNGGNNTTYTATISASPNPIAAGQSTTLSWSSNASSCTGTGFDTGNQAAGSVKVSPGATTTYSVNCGSAPVASVTVTVNAPSLVSLAITGQQSLTYGQTDQLAVTGTYSDGSEQNLTTSVAYQNPGNFGTVSATGLYTAPQQSGSATITASLGNITSPGFTITVTAPPAPTLTGVTPANLYSDGPGMYQWVVNGTGFEPGDILQSKLGSITLPQGIPPTQIPVIMDLDPVFWSPGPLPWQITTPQSNKIYSALFGPANLLTFSPTGESFNLDPASPQTVYKFKPDGSADGSFTALDGYSLSLDPTDGLISVGSLGAFDTYDQNGNVVGGASWDYSSNADIAALNGLTCGLLLTRSKVYCSTSQNYNSVNTATTNDDPIALVMVALNGATVAYVFDRTLHQICPYTVTANSVTPGPGNCVTLNGLSTGETGFGLIAVNPTAVALLDLSGSTLQLVNVASGTVSWQTTVPAGSFEITLNQAANTIDVAISMVPNQGTSYAAADLPTGNIMNLQATSQYFSVGFGVNPETGNLTSAMQGQEDLPGSGSGPFMRKNLSAGYEGTTVPIVAGKPVQCPNKQNPCNTVVLH